MFFFAADRIASCLDLGVIYLQRCLPSCLCFIVGLLMFFSFVQLCAFLWQFRYRVLLCDNRIVQVAWKCGIASVNIFAKMPSILPICYFVLIVGQMQFSFFFEGTICLFLLQSGHPLALGPCANRIIQVVWKWMIHVYIYLNWCLPLTNIFFVRVMMFFLFE